MLHYQKLENVDKYWLYEEMSVALDSDVLQQDDLISSCVNGKINSIASGI